MKIQNYQQRIQKNKNAHLDIHHPPRRRKLPPKVVALLDLGLKMAMIQVKIKKIIKKKKMKKIHQMTMTRGMKNPLVVVLLWERALLDPKNKDFEELYEIPCFGNNDFMFF